MSEIVPGYWMNETGGVLQPAMEAFLYGEELNDAQIAALRAYFRQWMKGSWLAGPEVNELRTSVEELTSVAAINAWLVRAEALGIDPL